MELLSLSKARNEMKDLINRVSYGKERICLTHHGKKMVVVVPVEDIDYLENIENSEDIRIAESRMKKIEEKGTYTFDELKKILSI